MRSIRVAAVAGASALSLMFGTTVAIAEEGKADNATVIEGAENNLTETEGEGSLSSRIDSTSSMEGDQPANGVALFGSSKQGFEDQPRWAQVMYAGTVIGTIASIIGMIVGPIHNWINHGPQA
ncbi:MAG: hypothetical protein Q4G50_13330 [Corynebacterium sp.]|uniref:hypothetical protein n=1 Tax=Corynebacterium sp. TaxID=1720 RepID=UPI0026DF963F|nr:hypothetical protein [Corynebacterium sp.]MDO5670966.1 hypothetical protein [Corynebacterium sp.]